MPDDVRALLGVIHPRQISDTTFEGASFDPGWGRLFGGQVFAQALSAARRTCPEDRALHATHADFLRKGDVSAPLRFDVELTRDGRTFSARRVVASQHGKTMLTLSASFQRPETGITHQDPMPDAPGPPDPATLERPQAPAARCFLSKMVDPVNHRAPIARPAVRQIWWRTRDPMPDNAADHRIVLAYASDFHMLTTSLQPHAMSFLTPGIRIATLNHAMWFHADFRMDEWLLYDVRSGAASGGRATVKGRVYRRDGTLVATTFQEGMVRLT
jgi:acyl-CoA thioesterase-2